MFVTGPASYTSDELAALNLDAAIEMYLDGRFIPAIVLATAAEMQFGGPHAPRTRDDRTIDPRAHQRDARELAEVYRIMFGERLPNPLDVVNNVKNHAKHYRAEPLRIDAENEAFQALDRAFHNRSLGNPVEHSRRGEVDARHDARGAMVENALCGVTRPFATD